jgi:hypothetical protein
MFTPLRINRRLLAVASLVGGVAIAPAVQAIPGSYQIVQTQTFTQSFSAFTNDSDSWTLVGPIVASMNPFSSYSTGSGTLNQVTIRWDNLGSFSGTAGAGGGSASGGSGGGVYVGNDSYNGNGSSSVSGSIAPNAPGSFSWSYAGSIPADYTFTPAGSGVTYNSAIYAILWGSGMISLKEDVSGSLSASDIASGLAQFTSTVTLTFDYIGEPIPVGAPGTALLTGLGLAGLLLRRRPGARVG